MTVSSIPWPVIIATWVPGFALWFYTWRKLRHVWREDALKQHPDPDAVMAQRQLYADGEFRRRWTHRSPYDLMVDRLDLECGHWAYHVADHPLAPDQLVDCPRCAREYLNSAKRLGERTK
jgi:hypothetical protein